MPSEIEREVEEEAEELGLSGTVESIRDSEWAVDGLAFAASDASNMGAGISTGSTVTVHVMRTDSDELIPREVELDESTEDEEGSTAEAGEGAEQGDGAGVGIRGTMGEGKWVIDGTVVLVTTDPELDGNLRPGLLVTV